MSLDFAFILIFALMAKTATSQAPSCLDYLSILHLNFRTTLSAARRAIAQTKEAKLDTGTTYSLQ